MANLTDFIKRNYIEGIVNDTGYNHVDMITYVIILFACVYLVLHLLNRLKIKVDEKLVIATVPYIFMGSVFRVIEDADILKPPVKYFFITPLIYFVIFAISFTILISAQHLEKMGKIKDHIRMYRDSGIIISIAGLVILVFNAYKNFNLDFFIYALVLSIGLTGLVVKISPFIGMVYLRSRVYSLAIFSFLLDSFTTYIGVDLLGYTNKHPLSSSMASVFGSDAVLVPLSLILVIFIILVLEKDSKNDKKEDEKYMLILTMIVLGLSMGARNLLAIAFGV